MRRGRLFWILAYLVAAVVAVGGGAYYVAHRNTSSAHPSSAPLPVLVGTAFGVTLSVFKQQRELAQGGSVEIGVQASAKQGIRSIELWDGSHKIDVSAPGEAGGASFSYPGVIVGPHLLYARAIATDGVSALSATYPIDVAPASVLPKSGAGSTPTVQVAVLGGESAADVAARLGLPSDSVALNAKPGTGLQTGLTATVVTPRTPDPLSGSAVTVAPGSASGPVAVSVTPNGCGVQAKVTGGSGTVTLAHAASGRPGFVVAGTLDAGSSMSLAHLMPGEHVLTAQIGTTQSMPVEFTVPQSCAAQAGWVGAVTLIGDQLTVPKPIDHGYVYVGVDDQPFVRIPADKSKFLSSAGRRIDLAGMMPALSGHKLVVQAWQQSGLKAAEIASGAFAPSSGLNLADVIGEPDVLTITGYANNGPEHSSMTLTKDQVVTYDWSDASTRVTGVQWQVLAVPLSAGIHDIDPVGLISTGYSPNKANDPPDPGSIYIAPDKPDSHGAFTIDTHTLERTTAAPTGNFFLDTYNTFAPQTFYVRAVALGPGGPNGTSNIPTGTVSQNIALTVPGVPTAVPDHFKVDAFLVLPGHAPNFDLADCIDVTGTHWQDWKKGGKYYDGTGDVPAMSAFYPKDGRYCWDEFDHPTGYCEDVLCEIGDVIDALASGLSDLWDLIATAYNGIITAVVDLIADFNPVCLAMSAASSSAGDACDSVGKIVARAAVSAVLSSFGLPPALPTSSQLKAIASGDLASIGETLLDELGVPCDSLTLDPSESAAVTQLGSSAGVPVPTDSDGQVDACRVAIEAAINVVKGGVEQQVSDEAAESTGLPPCPAGQCTVALDPGGHTQPLLINIIAHRTSGVAKPITFPVQITLLGGKNFTPSPFQGGTAKLSTVPGDPNEIIAFLSFDQPTPDFDINGVAPGDQILANLDDEGKYTGTQVINGTASAFGTYLPEIPR